MWRRGRGGGEREGGGGGGKVRMAVKMWKERRRSPAVVPSRGQALEQAGRPGNRWALDVTEEAVITDLNAARETLLAAKQLGVQIHMDDFGTGYSSLSYLHRFPFDVLKIDRAFMHTMNANMDYAAVLHTVVSLAHNLAMAVTV